MKKTALIVGSSGLVGKELLDLCLKSEVYEKVITPVRAPLSIENEKLIELIIDFEIPTGNPLLIIFGKNMKVEKYKYLCEMLRTIKNNME